MHLIIYYFLHWKLWFNENSQWRIQENQFQITFITNFSLSNLHILGKLFKKDITVTKLNNNIKNQFTFLELFQLQTESRKQQVVVDLLLKFRIRSMFKEGILLLYFSIAPTLLKHSTTNIYVYIILVSGKIEKNHLNEGK